jgi:small-conductance mechanosensitive channel
MSELERTLEAFATQAARPLGITQLALIVAALGAGWLVARVLRRQVSGKGRWHFGEGGFDRVAFPLAALGLLWAARLALARAQATPFLNVAIALLVAFAVIRFALYVLRYILPQGAILRGSERTVGSIMWIGVALHVTGLLPEIVDALEAVTVAVGKQHISLLVILQAVVSVAITLAISMWVARIIEGRVLAAESVEMSTRVVIAKLVYAVAFFAAILIALPVVGIDITALSVFGGALGVGLGFGLQKVASNYVSGFIILLDRSIRIGDLITVDARHGVVKAIESRYTVVRSLDGTESIIPNETMITQSVTNHSFTDRKVLLKVPVTVGYDSDVSAVFAILVRAAQRQPRVLAEPAPCAWIANLGDNGIEIELGVWISDPDLGQAILRGAILEEALKAFRAKGVEIPFPKRDVRLAQPAPAPP